MEINLDEELGDETQQTTVSASAAPQLASVSSLGGTTQRTAPPGALTFEGAEVSRSEVKITGTVAVDMPAGETVSMDDRIRLVGDFRVSKVVHYADKDGAIVRQQILAPCDDLQITPWDITDPTDNGILRMRP